jgi:hypothetical protein
MYACVSGKINKLSHMFREALVKVFFAILSIFLLLLGLMWTLTTYVTTSTFIQLNFETRWKPSFMQWKYFSFKIHTSSSMMFSSLYLNFVELHMGLQHNQHSHLVQISMHFIAVFKCVTLFRTIGIHSILVTCSSRTFTLP